MPKQISVLIVDDDANVCKTLSNILEKKGYATTVVDSGQRAIELSRERPFDVILTDVKMPVMSGVETYKKIKQYRPSAVIIFMTAFALQDLAKDMIGEGAYAVIEKPYEIDTVVNMIEKSQEGLLITLVDPDTDLRNTMKNALERKGYSITVCSTGEEAIALAKKKLHDIFFIDTKLPVLNGLETYLEIRKINSKIVVVMMTAYRQETDELVTQAIEKGAYSCLYKPFDMDKPVKLVEEISKKKRK